MTHKKCIKCGVDKPLKDYHKDRSYLRADCKVCSVKRHAAYQATVNGKAARRRANDKYIAAHPERGIANYSVNNALKAGKLIRPDTCAHCNARRELEGHHPDYSKPLDVIWLCIPCHVAIHNQPRI